MPKETYIFLGALVGAVAAYITAKITGNNQILITQKNADKDVLLQDKKLFDERVKSEISLEREKLEKLHIILSTIALENSQTMSYIQSDSDMPLNEYRTRYLSNCARLHEAQAISDIYYPEMSTDLRKIYSQSNMFWGAQEGVLRTDINENRNSWSAHLQEALKASKEISNRVEHLQYKISERSESLKTTLLRTN